MRNTIYKVFVFVPVESLDIIVEALRKGDINQLGNYKNCMSWRNVKSTWTSLDEATPYNGTPGQTTEAEEYELEFLCEERDLERAIAIIHKNHPYETAEIDI